MKIVYNYAVLTNFERFGSAANDRGMKPVLAGILCSVRQKSPIKFRLAGQFNRMPPNLAFFVCAAPSAIAANLNGLPEIEHRLTLPRVASLANLVEVSRNLCTQSGKLDAMWNRINPSCALGLVTDG